MDVAIIVALITSLFSLVGTIVTVTVTSRATQEKLTAELRTQNEVQNNEIKHLSTELKKLSDFAVKIPKLEGDIKLLEEKLSVANHRIADLETINKLTGKA